MTQTRPEPKVIIIPAKEETLQDQKKKKNLLMLCFLRKVPPIQKMSLKEREYSISCCLYF